MISLTQFVGMAVAAGAGGASAWAITRLWRLARISWFGAPLLGAAVAAPCAFLLQMLGAGGVGLQEGRGVIDWPPVLSTLIVGGGCGVLMATAVGLMRLGGRTQRR